LKGNRNNAQAFFSFPALSIPNNDFGVIYIYRDLPHDDKTRSYCRYRLVFSNGRTIGVLSTSLINFKGGIDEM